MLGLKPRLSLVLCPTTTAAGHHSGNITKHSGAARGRGYTKLTLLSDSHSDSPFITCRTVTSKNTVDSG